MSDHSLEDVHLIIDQILLLLYYENLWTELNWCKVLVYDDWTQPTHLSHTIRVATFCRSCTHLPRMRKHIFVQTGLPTVDLLIINMSNWSSTWDNINLQNTTAKLKPTKMCFSFLSPQFVYIPAESELTWMTECLNTDLFQLSVWELGIFCIAFFLPSCWMNIYWIMKRFIFSCKAAWRSREMPPVKIKVASC